MRIGFLGNFLVPYSTETHCAKTLGAMGHRVQCLQETVATAGQIAKATQECDLFIWTHTHGWHTPDIEVAFANAIARGRIPIITYHLDLWHGLGRERDMHTDPYWKVLTDFFTVDARMADWLNANTKIKGHYLPAGVFDQECYMAPPDNDRFDVCFVGSRRYHPEWPYRPKLIDWLENTYKGRFRLYGQDGLGVRRGEALNQIYANSRVVVGDTLCLGYTYPDYWSDRIYETTGRGGFLIHPRIEGINTQFVDGEEVVFYDYDNFPQLKSLIDYYLANPEEREAIRKAGHERTKNEHTYKHRWTTILNTLGLK